MAKGKKSGGSGKPGMTAEVDASAVKKAAADLDAALPKETDAALRSLGDDFVAEARRKVRSGPGRSSGEGSRDRIARGIDYSVKDGRLRLTSDPQMQSRHKGFPAAYNLERWMHPVFGRRARVSQRGASFWHPGKYAGRAEQLLNDAAQRAADKVDR